MKKTILFISIAMLFFYGLRAEEPDKWEVFKSRHFLVYYKSAPNDFIAQVSEKCEEYYNKIAEALGFSRYNFWLWDDRARIYIYDDANDYWKATGQPAWSHGLALPGGKIIRTYAGEEQFLETTLPHEMGHIIFREFVGFSNPAVTLWLDEGVASYQEKHKYSIANNVLKDALAKNTFIDLMKLSQFDMLAKTSDVQTVELFYLESFSLIDFLIAKFGKDTFVSFCQNLRDKRSLTAALSSSYNFSDLKELDRAWQDYILGHQ